MLKQDDALKTEYLSPDKVLNESSPKATVLIGYGQESGYLS